MPLIALRFCGVIIKMVRVEGYTPNYYLRVCSYPNYYDICSACEMPRVTLTAIVMVFEPRFGERVECKECGCNTITVYDFVGVKVD